MQPRNRVGAYASTYPAFPDATETQSMQALLLLLLLLLMSYDDRMLLLLLLQQLALMPTRL